MRKVLILVLSAEMEPYGKMAETSLRTWDSIEVEWCETVYYFGASTKANTDKFIYLPVGESFYTMGQKLMLAFEWALENKEFDYIARPHSSIYVDKKKLMGYIKELPETDVFAGAMVEAEQRWMWGGVGYIFSKDVIKKIVATKGWIRQDLMEDMALSYLINRLGIPYTQGLSCSIDKQENGWLCLSYGGQSISFTNFEDLKPLNHYYYRVKQDGKRWVDEFIMEELFKVLK